MESEVVTTYAIPKTLLSVILTACGVARATYPGSIITSWDGSYKEGSFTFTPMGFTHDGQHIHVYTGNWLFKRLPSNGSVVSSVPRTILPPHALGYQVATRHLYVGDYVNGIYIVNYSNGEVIASYPVPSGLTRVNALDYNDAEPSSPVWVADRTLPVLYKLTASCSFVCSFSTSFSNVTGLAYAAECPGGPYLFAASAPRTIYALDPTSASVHYSFDIELPNGVGDLAWDSNYLWADDGYFRSCGYVYQFVALPSGPGITPSSFGKIKVMYR